MPGPTERLSTVEMFGPKGAVVVNASEAAAWRARGYCASESEFAARKAEKAAKAAGGKTDPAAEVAVGAK